MSERRAEFLLALTTVFWSGTFVFTKFALLDCDPIFFVTLRFLIATAVAALLWMRRPHLVHPSVLRDGAILGFLYGAGFFFQTWGLQFTSISKSAFITGMVVIFMPGADWLVRRKRATTIHIIAVLIATVGLALLTHPDLDNINKGDAMTICGSIMWSLYISFLDKSSSRSTSVPRYTEHIVVIQFATTLLMGILAHSLLALVHVGTTADSQTPMGSLSANVTVSLLIALVYTALIGSLASTYVQTKVQRFVAPVKAGIIFTLEPIFASAIAYFTHHERLTAMEGGGALLMIAAIIFADVAPGIIRKWRTV